MLLSRKPMPNTEQLSQALEFLSGGINFKFAYNSLLASCFAAELFRIARFSKFFSYRGFRLIVYNGL